MSENKIIGIVDEPISSGKSDALKIGLRVVALPAGIIAANYNNLLDKK